MKPPNKGFTLIELVVVIVILGILAATALPKFVDLGKDARIASVRSLAGAVKAGAQLAHAKCVVIPGCYKSNSPSITDITVVNSPVPHPSKPGVVGYMFNGYPAGYSRVSVTGYSGMDKYYGIKDWVDYTGFTVVETLGSPSEAEFRKDGANDLTKCYVKYKTIYTYGEVPEVSMDVSGC